MDFEAAAWRAFQYLLPHVKVRGCVFHLTHAIWRHCQEIGLQRAYRENDFVFKFIRRLMALPFMPASHIRPIFRQLKQKAPDGKLSDLCVYMERQWMANSIFKVASWSVFNQTTRKNNHVEGWHHRINIKAGEQQLGIYKMIPCLYQEISMLPVQCKLMQEKKIGRHLRTSACRSQQELFRNWTQYKDGDRSPAELLNACATLNGPTHSEGSSQH
ncbi:uncharacterized protein LOC121371359 [Gigantopelta aegis]|uniref:uncharacterized protein LOC121371359 n=1 Tax=Gigantopelta aegis TaxID=1735272 RepID=UPI001B887CAB|nr:uncharacterized protein LOC121371359 [Gigantopelta aegis]